MSRLMDYLDQVRARPEAARRRLLWLWTSGLTLLLVGLWLFNLYLTGNWSGGARSADLTAASSTPAWWANVKAGWQVVKERRP